ncbi:MAG: HutD family protein [Clostridium sp.]|uniref:HutD/Ves family protein n=1 Tax=Clostridium sp. TaxID=1506 RepID=UPI00302B7D9E
MSYKIELVTKKQIKTSTWSGGTTSEIYIYPENSNYKDLNFKWRVSSATVDLEHSTFTPLPNIYRFITPLEGNMSLSHDNGDLIYLNPFEIHEFSGDVNTESFGKVKDFNLMLGTGCIGSMTHISLNEDIRVTMNLNNLCPNYKMFSNIFYSPIESISITIDNKIISLNSGDALILHMSIGDIIPDVELHSENKCNVLNLQIHILK